MRKRSNASALCKATGPSDIWLNDVDGPLGNQLTKAIGPHFRFIASDSGPYSPCDFGTALDVVRGHGLFDPVEVLRLHRPTHLDSQRGAPGTVDIDHQFGLAAKNTSDGLNTRQVFLKTDHTLVVHGEHLTEIRLG